ncbi:MAG: Flp family type IVb pilin [Candidatus Omnitrophica bacterium]|nr:Flp family type IVb pilin [Candidatus Omnitrophota bacterium]
MMTRLLKDESGQTMVEYGLLVALISIAVIGVLVALGPRIRDFFQNVDDRLRENTPVTPTPTP